MAVGSSSSDDGLVRRPIEPIARRAARCQWDERSESRGVTAMSAAAPARGRDATAALDGDERRTERTLGNG
jgi:hypothetical protein